MWRRALAVPYADRHGVIRRRSPETIDAWLVPVRLMYEWAASQELLRTNLAELMSESRYFAPGTTPGGEYGRSSKVLSRELRSARRRSRSTKKWISDPLARQKLLDTELPSRDRFLIDLLYFTGIRIGEALTLRIVDLHFGGAPDESPCRILDPHFHVGENNTGSGPSAKGKRTLYANSRVVDSYIDYAMERAHLLGVDDPSPLVFVTLYSTATPPHRPLGYGGARHIIRRLGASIGFPLSGPHMLRHTLATRLRRGHECDEVAPDVVQAILGHASITTTNEYTHDIEDLMRAAMTGTPPRSVALESDQ